MSSLCRSLGQCWIYLVNAFCQSKSTTAASVQSLKGHIILLSKLLLYFMSKSSVLFVLCKKNILEAQNQIGIKLKEYLLNSIEFNILTEHKESFTHALPYIVFVLAEAGYSEISTVVCVGTKMGYDMKNIIYNLVTDILKTSLHENTFTEEQRIKLIENTRYSEWLLRNPSPCLKILQNTSSTCSQHLMISQFSYLSTYPLVTFLHLYNNNWYCFRTS